MNIQILHYKNYQMILSLISIIIDLFHLAKMIRFNQDQRNEVKSIFYEIINNTFISSILWPISKSTFLAFSL